MESTIIGGLRRAPFLRLAMVLVVLSQLFSGIGTCAEKKKKILYVDSYHIEYTWSADVTAGVEAVIGKRDDVELRITRMDTKRNKSEEFKKQAALKVKKIIDEWRPDVVIASDDNASKYLIAPYYKNSDIPFVFCGLNWDASVYGFPTVNITGMVEVAMFREVVDYLKSIAGGNKIGYLGSDVVTERKELANTRKKFHLELDARLVKTFDELKNAFLELQQRNDILVFAEAKSVQGFNHREFVDFTREHTVIPTGATQRYMSPYALVTFSRIGEEQGEYAARTALAILDGASPSDFPVVTNKKAKVFLNMRLARKLGVKFPVEMISRAHLISAEQKKLLYINSYHQGYKWSDSIEDGLRRALQITVTPDGTYDISKSEVKFKVFRMDTKRNKSEEFARRQAREAKRLIDEWQPDVVVTSDDAAAKYVIAEYYKNSPTPFVFCGVNWSVAEYGLPTENVTGMVEVSPVLETIRMISEYAGGSRIGFMAAENRTNRKNIDNITRRLGVTFADGAYVKDFAEWRREYRRLQDSVDMVLWITTSVLDDWNEQEAVQFILRETKIPSGSTSDHQAAYTLLGNVKIGEEQGWWAGKTALRILEGESPANIPVTTNKERLLYLNMKLAKRLGIKFPMPLVEKAIFVGEEGAFP